MKVGTAREFIRKKFIHMSLLFLAEPSFRILFKPSFFKIRMCTNLNSYRLGLDEISETPPIKKILGLSQKSLSIKFN